MAELLSGSGSLDVTDSSNTTRFPEAMAPSAVNNGVRALEGMLARYLKDSNGSVAVAGTDTYTATINADTGFALYDGFIFAGDFANGNTGAATINLTPDGGSALGAVDIKKNSTAALASGDIAAGQKCILIYDGSTSDFQLINPTVSDTGLLNVVEDTTPQLGGTLDTNSQSIQFTGATVTDVTGADTLLVSGTAGTSGNVVEWNADGDAIDSGVATSSLTGKIGETLETAQATTTGTEFDYTSLPAGIEAIQVMFDTVSLSGSDNIQVQIGDSGGLHTTGYVSESGTGTSTVSSTAGMAIRVNSSTRDFMGSVMLNRMDGNKWSASIAGADTSSGVACVGGGIVTLDTALDRVRILATGSDTFDAGAVNIRYWS